MLAGKHVVLGVTGGVAAYKSAYVARRLITQGAEVEVVMTVAAQRFVGPSTFAAITGRSPILSLFDDRRVSPHTELARWADAVLVVPATASTLAKIATGQSSNALVATVLATRAPLLLAPAMHTEMWEHPATQRNLRDLAAFGYVVIPPEVGALAGGDQGVGRLADPDDIVERLTALFTPGDLVGRRIVVTAGGTRQPIDPVRYIGNRSSGKMGHALAAEAADRGADVVLVSTVPYEGDSRKVECIAVETAEEMAAATWTHAASSDAVIMAAAVADFTPADPIDVKLRRSEGTPTITLTATPDVLAGVVALEDRPFVVGFAAEVGDLTSAVDKAQRKGVDLLVANDIAKQGSGFGSETNEVTIINPDGSQEHLPLMSKRAVAGEILDRVAAGLDAR